MIHLLPLVSVPVIITNTAVTAIPDILRCYLRTLLIMNKEYNYVYQYLEQERIYIDKSEFEIQIQAHPQYPYLLAITDTLHFFNIQNGVIRAEVSEIELLPDHFAAVLKEEGKESQFYFIRKNKKNYTYRTGNTAVELTEQQLRSLWCNTVFLIEKSETKDRPEPCRPCLFITLLFLSEIFYLVVNISTSATFSLQSLCIFGLLFLFTFLLWRSIKSFFVKYQVMRESLVQRNLFVDNYETFKSLLLRSEKIQQSLLPSSVIALGNKDAKLKIILIVNPFSAKSGTAHFIMAEILEKHYDLVSVEVRFHFDHDDYGYKKSKMIHYQLVYLYLSEGPQAFMTGLHNWFSYQDERKLCSSKIATENEIIIKEILKDQFRSNIEDNLFFAPIFIINQYIYPKQYDYKKLINFIEELSEDPEFDI